MRCVRASLLFGLIGSTALAGALDWDPTRGSVRTLTFDRAEAPRYAGDAVAAARAFLDENRALFNGVAARTAVPPGAGGDGVSPRLDAGERPEVRVSRVDELDGVSFVRMQQVHAGLEVDGGDLVVALRADGSVSSVQGGYAARAHQARGLAPEVGIPAAEALAIARADLAAAVPGGHQADQLVWWVAPDGRLVKAHRVDLGAVVPRGDWRYFVDAATGEVLSKQNLLLFYQEAPGPRAMVLMTNPLHDPDLTGVNLEHLVGSQARLIGQYVRVLNGKAEEVEADPDGNFVVPQSSTHWAEVNAYFHVDRIHQNLKEIDPAFQGMDWPISITVHEAVGYDGAHYSPAKKEIFIRDPRRLNDFHREAALTYHEYHHAVTDAVVPGLFGPETTALNEGYSDYFACAFTADARIGEWVLQPLGLPYARNLESQRHYPEDLDPEGDPHSDGEIFAAACWTLRRIIPADKADFLVHRSRFYLSSSAVFWTAYNGMRRADDDYLGGQYADAITAVFLARGIAQGATGEGAHGDGAQLARRLRFRDLYPDAAGLAPTDR